jgi:hypothetical protein
MIAASKEEMAIAKPHVSDDEDEDRKPCGKSLSVRTPKLHSSIHPLYIQIFTHIR